MAPKILIYLLAVTVIVSINRDSRLFADGQKCTVLSSSAVSHPHGCMNAIQKFCDFGVDYSYVTEKWLSNAVVAQCPSIGALRAPGLTQYCQFMFGCSSDSDCVEFNAPSRQTPLCKDSCERCFAGASCPAHLEPYIAKSSDMCVELDPLVASAALSSDRSLPSFVVGSIIAAVVVSLVVVGALCLTSRRKRIKELAPRVKTDKHGATAVLATPVEHRNTQPANPPQQQQQPQQQQHSPPQISGYSPSPAYTDAEQPPPRAVDTQRPDLVLALIDKLRSSPSLSSHYIDYNELEFQRQLGKGAFGVVYQGVLRGMQVAIKKSNMTVASQSDIDGIIREAELMLSFPPSPYVMQVVGISFHETEFLIISEYCAQGSLDKHFGKDDLSFDTKMRLIHEIALGVAHIHKYGIVHRDLAARNVLLDENFHGKICDFGMSRQLIAQDDSAEGAIVGPLKYMAPESLAKRIFSMQTDVWTFGVVCSEILNETTPHNDLELTEAALKIRDEFLTPSLPAETPDYVLELCGHCWAPEPEHRPSMQEVVDVFGREIGVL